MARPPYADGDAIPEGRLYRRVPPWPTHFDAVRRAPRPATFFPRPQDRGALSAHLAAYVTVAEACRDPRRPDDPRYGLCEVDIATMIRATAGAVSVHYAPSAGTLGHAHVVVRGVTDAAVAARIAQVARLVRVPG